MKRLLALAGIVAVLCAMVGLNFRWMERPVDLSPILSENTSPTLSLDNSLGEASGSVPELQITETLLRPLFHASRRPFVPPPPADVTLPVVAEEPLLSPAVVPEQAVQPEVKPDLRLAGVSISGAEKRALLGLAAGPDVRWYSQGDNLDGWTVASITNHAVTLANGDKSFTVPLYPSSAAGGVER